IASTQLRRDKWLRLERQGHDIVADDAGLPWTVTRGAFEIRDVRSGDRTAPRIGVAAGEQTSGPGAVEMGALHQVAGQHDNASEVGELATIGTLQSNTRSRGCKGKVREGWDYWAVPIHRRPVGYFSHTSFVSFGGPALPQAS